jgi:hypothetical protein
LADFEPSGGGKQHHPGGGSGALLLHGPITKEQAEKEAEAAYKSRQLALTEAGNKHTRTYVILTSVLAILSALGTGAAWYQGFVANQNAGSAKIAADAAKSAADTADATLKEMRTGQGAQDTHKLALAAQTQAGASKTSADAAKSAADTAKSALELQSTPWLGIEPGDVAFDASTERYPPNNKFSVKFKIPLHNFGSAPALNVNVYYDPKAYKYGGKYHGPEFFKELNVCTDPQQNERDVERPYNEGENIVWPTSTWNSPVFVDVDKSPSTYVPGCISYRDVAGNLKHVSFVYQIFVTPYPSDGTGKYDQFSRVTLFNLKLMK